MIERSMYVSVLWGYPVSNVKIESLRLGFGDLDPNPHLFLLELPLEWDIGISLLLDLVYVYITRNRV
jgi:hypothetical protein